MVPGGPTSGLTADQVYALDLLLASDHSETPGARVEPVGDLFKVRATADVIASGQAAYAAFRAAILCGH